MLYKTLIPVKKINRAELVSLTWFKMHSLRGICIPPKGKFLWQSAPLIIITEKQPTNQPTNHNKRVFITADEAWVKTAKIEMYLLVSARLNSQSLHDYRYWLGSGGKLIGELCSDACTWANDLVFVEGAPSMMVIGTAWTLSSLQAELVDVQYGTMEDLIRIQAITNVTKKIALLKLGQSPLLYKVSQMLAAL